MSSGEWYLIDIIARLLSWPPCARSGAVRRWQLTPIMPLEGRGRGGSVGHRVRAAVRYAAGSLQLLCRFFTGCKSFMCPMLSKGIE